MRNKDVVKYFAYGSNMDPDRMNKRGVKFSSRKWALLRGYKLEFNKVSSLNPKEGYANIVVDKESTVEGILYEIEKSDLLKLDRWEGVPTHYKRIVVKVRLKDGKIVEAFTYVANPQKVKNGLRPSKAYLSHLLKGCDLLSKEYCKWLKSQETLD